MLRIAFRFMMYEKAKTIGAMVGVIVAIFLIGQQTGIFLFLTGLMDAMVTHTKAEVWIVDKNVDDVNSLATIDVRNGNEIRSVPGVESVSPLIIAGSTLRLKNGKTTPVQIIGSLPPTFTGGPWNVVKGNIHNLIDYGGISADQYDLRNLGHLDIGDEVSLGGKLVELKAVSEGVRGFGANYIFSNISLAREIGKFPQNKVSAFLVNVKKGYTPEEVVQQINKNFPGIRAWTKKDFSRSTVIKVLKDGGIGQSVGSLILFAIIAGGVIIGLTLYSSAIDRIDDYATMKAIGAKRKVVSRLILLQAFIISLIGFTIGAIFIEGFRKGVENSGVLFSFSWWMWLIFFFLTLAISLSGAWFASKSIRKVEPSKVF